MPHYLLEIYSTSKLRQSFTFARSSRCRLIYGSLMCIMDVADLIHADRNHTLHETSKHYRPSSRRMPGNSHLTNGYRKTTPPSPVVREFSNGVTPPSPSQTQDSSRSLTLPSIHTLMDVADASVYGNGAFKGHRGRQAHAAEKRSSIRKSPVSVISWVQQTPLFNEETHWAW